jgi:hypothetical protein
MAVLTPVPKMQFFDINGEPLVGGKVYTYQAGTTTPLATYTDNTNAYANPNPVILNARGEAAIWLGGLNYKFRLTDANDVEIWTVDYISGPISGVSPALSGNVTIDTDSSNPALKITQIGTGYALRVQDETDPDTTPLVIDNTGKLGVGTLSPSELVDISGGNLALTSAGGTLYAKVTPGASLTDIAAAGARALTLTTNSVERIRVTDTGLVGIGKTPAAGVELDVLGDVAASGNVTATTAVVTDTISERTSAAGVTIDGVLCKDSQVAPVNRVITAGTAVATTSGTSVEFTSIPSWVKRITVMFYQVSLSGSDNILIQIGPSGSVVTSGYNSSFGWAINASNTIGIAATNGFIVAAGAATYAVTGVYTIMLQNPSTFVYVGAGSTYQLDTTGAVAAGGVDLTGAVTNVKILATGSNTFDAGSVNIFYE